MSIKRQSNSLKKMLLLIACLGLVACQSFNNKDQATQAKDYSMPELKPTYSNDEVVAFNNKLNQGKANQYEGLKPYNKPILTAPEELPSSLFYDSGIQIPYPKEGVKGIYLPQSVFGDPEQFKQLIDYIDQTALNAVVIDFKDDYGNILSDVDTKNELIQKHVTGNVDYKQILKELEKHQIYPIARIVTFKDNRLSDDKPDFSFKDSQTGEIWQDGNGSQFINPFLKDVWDYNVQVAIEAAKLGFKEVQFDYVRFPEGFETFASQLTYDLGDFAAYVTDDPEKFGQERVYAINGYLEYAKDQLAPYGADISADVFGYTAIAQNSADVRGIGQDFKDMAERVDVISSMIYPSHWGPGFFGIAYPDLEPYNLVNQYIYSEKLLLDTVSNPVVTRPWLQDFTSYGMPAGTFQEYGPTQVQQQIVALEENGVHEFLLWNANGIYTQGVDYAPESSGNDYYY
ncbi:putative glycoside hydrolase [Facklamia hominis]